jgi:hypothetical protein
MKIALYLSSLGFKGIWFSAGRDQVEQPKIYLNNIINHSHLKFAYQEKLKLSVTFKNGGMLILKGLTELNARSSRADFIIYDEEAQANEDAYRAGVNILAGSELGMVFHISTPVKGTIFEENFERLKRLEVLRDEQFTFKVAWHEAPFLSKNREWYEEQKRILPGWYFRQEHECSFELPAGAVFQNVDYGTYPEHFQREIRKQPQLSGNDWNPVSGHWLVGCKWTLDYKHVFVVEELDLGRGYATDMNINQFTVLASRMSEGGRLVLESGGLNEEYVQWFYKLLDETRWNRANQQFALEEWDAAGKEKLRACTYIIQNGVTIHVDEQRFPVLAKAISECRWDPEASEPRLAKSRADSPHALDAFLHACSEKNRDFEMYEVIDWEVVDW